MGFFRRLRINFVFVLATITLFTLIILTILLIKNYALHVSDLSDTAAHNHSIDLAADLDNLLSPYLQNVDSIVTEMPSSKEDIPDFLHDHIYNKTTSIRTIRYFKDGVEYDFNNVIYTEELPQALALSASGELSISGIIVDPEINTSLIAVYSPVPAAAYADGVLVYFYLSDFINTAESVMGSSQISGRYKGLCQSDGSIIVELNRDSIDIQKNTNIFTELRGLINSKALTDRLERSVKNDISSFLDVSITGVSYKVIHTTLPILQGKWFVLEILQTDVLMSSERSLISTISGLLAIISIVFLLLLIYVFVDKYKMLNKLDEYETVNPLLGSPTYKKFGHDTDSLLSKNKVATYALVYLRVIRYAYIVENFGAPVGDSILRFIAEVSGNILSPSEAYGHVGDEKFAYLLRYKSTQELVDRLKVMVSVIENMPEMKPHNHNLKVGVGIYLVDRTENLTVQGMLDRAIITQETGERLRDSLISVYSHEIFNKYKAESEIESKMEGALKNGEFTVFYQPKYNISQNRPDGCEALVRWYNAETDTYRQPNEFLPIFERNGFITKLDRYIFTESCMFMSQAITRGDKVVPFSINVSGPTAIQEGFVEYYIHTKNKYRISDGFITLEFTESFAYDNYDTLKEVVDKLKRNGFMCSIDDFGAGFSSFRVLKELQMNELKLDRFFVSPGASREKDNRLLENIITLAKTLGMKVTQEGVETADELERLKRFGCDVVQGFYYSRPLPPKEYTAFINTGGIL